VERPSRAGHRPTLLEVARAVIERAFARPSGSPRRILIAGTAEALAGAAIIGVGTWSTAWIVLWGVLATLSAIGVLMRAPLVRVTSGILLVPAALLAAAWCLVGLALGGITSPEDVRAVTELGAVAVAGAVAVFALGLGRYFAFIFVFFN